jgi:hypothetical protein
MPLPRNGQGSTSGGGNAADEWAVGIGPNARGNARRQFDPKTRGLSSLVNGHISSSCLHETPFHQSAKYQATIQLTMYVNTIGIAHKKTDLVIRSVGENLII